MNVTLCEKMMIVQILVLLVMRISAYSAYKCDPICICPSAENIVCERPGLRRIPSQLNELVNVVMFRHQNFDSNILIRRNFSHFTKPSYFLRKLTIRQSNIQRITNSTFYDLDGLDELDLSNNKRIIVDYKAFANLKLQILMLNNIKQLVLVEGSFKDAEISSLTITNSSLTELPFAVLKPLVRKLLKLNIENNKLTHLSNKFYESFTKLKFLRLTGNPFHCICPMLWLSKTLKWRESQSKVRNSMHGNVYAKCASPAYVRDRNIYELTSDHYNCDPPQLYKIELKYQSRNLVFLKCAALIKPMKAPMTISWKKYNYYSPSDSITVSSDSSDRHETTLKLSYSQYNRQDKYFCFASSSSGNASIKVGLTWPPQIHSSRSTNENRPNNSRKVVPSFKPPIYQENIFFKQQFTLLELILSIVGTFILTMILFIGIYKYYFYRNVRIKKEQLKKSGYATYEVGLYSTDSQTYDIPNCQPYNSSLRASSIPIGGGQGPDSRPTKLLQPLYPTVKNNFYIDNQTDRVKV